jgi:hypothetical protein
VTAEPPTPDLKVLWQDQLQEIDPMTLEQVRILARRYEAMARRGMFIAIGAVAFGFFVFGQERHMFHDPLRRTGVALLAAGILFSMLRGSWLLFPRRDPAEPAGSFLRRQLQTYLRNARGGWLIQLVALVPGVVVLEIGLLRTPSLVPLWARALPLALMMVVLGVVVVQNRRSARRFKRELAELDALLKS